MLLLWTKCVSLMRNVCCVTFMSHLSHSRVNVLVADDLVPVWHTLYIVVTLFFGYKIHANWALVQITKETRVIWLISFYIAVNGCQFYVNGLGLYSYFRTSCGLNIFSVKLFFGIIKLWHDIFLLIACLPSNIEVFFYAYLRQWAVHKWSRHRLSVYLAPRHYLTQHWLIAHGTKGNKRRWNKNKIFVLTLSMRGPSYLGLTRSISWLLMPWLLGSPGHQQPWYRLCEIGKSWSYTRKDFNYLWHISVEEWHKCEYVFMFPLKNLARKEF